MKAGDRRGSREGGGGEEVRVCVQLKSCCSGEVGAVTMAEEGGGGGGRGD